MTQKRYMLKHRKELVGFKNFDEGLYLSVYRVLVFFEWVNDLCEDRNADFVVLAGMKLPKDWVKDV